MADYKYPVSVSLIVYLFLKILGKTNILISQYGRNAPAGNNASKPACPASFSLSGMQMAPARRQVTNRKKQVNNYMEFLKNLFRPSAKHNGVWPIQIYVLKLFFLLMFLFVAKDAWTELITHQGEWNAEVAIAWCAIAAYTTLSGLGIFHTLKMLPIMLFMFLYKGLWLIFVAYPLWQNGNLEGSEADGWAQIFMLIVIPIIFTPWKYVFKTYVLGKEKI